MMCVCLSHSHHSFSPQIFFLGEGERGDGAPFFQIPSLILYFIEISFDLFQKKAPPGRAVPLIK